MCENPFIAKIYQLLNFLFSFGVFISYFSWRTLRVFISSTFKDMHGERDLLTRFVFPELRSLGRKHFINIYEVDLRWGATEQDRWVMYFCIFYIHIRNFCIFALYYVFLMSNLSNYLKSKHNMLFMNCQSYNFYVIFHGNYCYWVELESCNFKSFCAIVSLCLKYVRFVNFLFKYWLLSSSSYPSLFERAGIDPLKRVGPAWLVSISHAKIGG